jgi:hypothetical protein
MCKNGDYYWVFANVTPDLDASGQVAGYFSVRRKASAQAIALMTEVYRAMLDAERGAGPKDACDASLALLGKILQDKGVSYEQLVLSL